MPGECASPHFSPTLVTSASNSPPRSAIDLRTIISIVQADLCLSLPIFLDQFWRHSQGTVSQDVHAINPSFSAPTVVPDIGTLEMGPAWGVTSHTCPIAVHGSVQPSGAVQLNMQEPPPTSYCFCYLS